MATSNSTFDKEISHKRHKRLKRERFFVFLCLLWLIFSVESATTMAQQAQFEVATVKLSPPVPAGTPLAVNLGALRNGVATLTNVTLAECIQYAYDLPSNSLIAGPDWINVRDVRFDIVAKTSPDTPRDQVLQMMQNLLAERLQLKLHHEPRQQSFLALVVGKNGPKLPPAKDAAIPPQIAGRILHPRMPMTMLATLLSRFERQLILDKTGFEGPFSVDLQWIPEALRERALQGGPPPTLNGQPVDLNGPLIYTALQEQLGLRLESRKGPVDTLVIDHAEKVPADN
jgi:uncharacterized protein (TIGR03435 family)